MQTTTTVPVQDPTAAKEEREDTTVLTMMPQMQLVITASDPEDRVSAKDTTLTMSIANKLLNELLRFN